ncbi:response regulator transcription factor [Priestia koreensis]|uniref:response regulator transcription factor n=1 Tax=Priestia koreensis TaxID=284581 RepID=UPI003457EBB7
MSQKILIVEDDHHISAMVKGALEREGFEATAVFDGEQALTRLKSHTYSMILLDLMLPKLDGMECLKIIRSTSMVPILIMSAKDEDLDKALGLGFGADDYISKPFSMIELLARIKAILRRQAHYMNVAVPTQNEDHVIHIGNLMVNLHSFSVLKNGENVALTAKEFHILKLLISNPSNVYTKSQIYQAVWKDDYHGDENVINVHIRRLREKIEDDPSHPVYIKTLWGIGYKLGDVS